MNWSSLLSPRVWAHRAHERVWQLAPGAPCDPVTRNWIVDPDALAATVVRWPTTYQWKPRRILGDQILSALRRHVRVELRDVPQRYHGVINFEVDIDGKRHRVNVETSDYPELNETAYADAELHFKMEYRLEGYGERDRLLPGSYVNADRVIYRYLPRLRRMRDQLPPAFQVYGRYGLSMEKRRRPLEILRNSSRFDFAGGEGKVRYSRFLEEVARARVCIDLPSMSSITFRMIDYLAIGTCIVGPPHTCQLLHPFVDGVHVAYCRADYSDLEEVCAHYLEHDEERAELVRNSRAFFDAYVHRDQLASYYLYHCIQRLR